MAYALVNMIGSMSNIYGAYFFPVASAPQFIPGWTVLCSFAFDGVIAAAAFGLYLRNENQKSTALGIQDGRSL